MKYSQARLGRVFVIRLEDGDIVHEELEKLAAKENIKAAGVIILGGADKESILISGPEKGRVQPIVPMEHILENVHEAVGTGTIFPDEDGTPSLHMHLSCGRKTSVVTGCVRKGVKVWHIMEAIVFELTGTPAKRVFDPQTGFNLLWP